MAIEARWASGQYERLPAMAADLIQRQTTVIVALSNACGACGKDSDCNDPCCLHNHQRSSANGSRREPEPSG